MPDEHPPAGVDGAARGDGPHGLRELRPLPLLARRALSATVRTVVVYTDGACRGNPGPGGWGALIVDGTTEREVSGGEPHTTNQRMELRAAIEALAAIPDRRGVDLYTDSSYVMNCFRDRWWEKWERNGWRGSAKQPVTNRDLWERLIAETRRHEVTWHKVKGHSGDPLNDRVDRLARQAIGAAAAR